jgi:hypothetical protein
MASLLDLLGQTWPARMGQAAWQAFKAPGDAYAGRLDPLSEEGISRATDLAGMVMGGTSFSAPRGALGSGLVDPLYHGSSRGGLLELNPSVSGGLGPGVYASPARQIAERYAWKDVPVYQLPQKTRDVYRGHGHRTDEEWFGYKADNARLLAAAEPEKRKEIEDILSKGWSNTGYETWSQIRRLYKNDEDAAQNLFKRAGFEGISGLVDGPEVLLFEKQPLK